VFVWSSLDCELDGGFAAGLIAGDGCLWIRPNNSGATWGCGLGLALRADDTPLLARLCRWTGLGRLSAVPAQRNSKPQTRWTVSRQADCLRLFSLLDRHRLIGKKRGEYEIWRRAVLAWTGGQSERHEVIARSRHELRAYRAFENAPGPSRVDITEHSLMAFFAGFVTAEAHLGVTPEGHPFFRINVRADDGYVLRLFRDRLDLGRLVEVPPYGSSCAALSWRIGRLAELRSLTQCLDWYPPRGRVFRIFEAWRDLVLLEDRRGARRKLGGEVRRRRAYKPGLGTIVDVDPLRERRTRYLAVLKGWAGASERRRTATAYEAWRKSACPKAPKRDTIAAAFGSWIAALEAAGLSSEGCRSPGEIARAQAAAAAARPARLERQRAAILAAAQECAQALGRPPRASEFFGWRNRFAPEVPCQMTVYRAFPGGWQSVLDSLVEHAGSPAGADRLEPPPQPLHVAATPREQLTREPDVQAGPVDQLGHEGVACHEIAAGQRE
jgi:hypothetical protein